LRDCKDPTAQYQRLCIPERFLTDAFITPDHLKAPTAKGQTRAVIDRVLDGVDRLLAEATPLPKLIRSQGLALHAAIVLCRARKLAELFRIRDPLSEKVHLAPLTRYICKVRAVAGIFLNRL
jgi:phytoene/squalene synthetase